MDSIRIRKGFTKEEMLLCIIFLVYFCSDIVSAAVLRLLGQQAMLYAYLILFFIPFIVYVPAHLDRVKAPLAVFAIVAFLFFLTFLFHPEYAPWFTHELYGVIPSFVFPYSAIWAFLVIWIEKNDKELLNHLFLACWLLFFFYSLQFIAARVRGGWVQINAYKEVVQEKYNLEFGYNMVFPTAFMGAYGCLKGKKLYYIPYTLGVLMILIGGSRGAAIWPIALFLLIIPLKWNNLRGKKRVVFLITLILLFVLAILLLFSFKTIIAAISNFLSVRGWESRTLETIMSGSYSDPNGRDKIYSMAAGLIKTGGLFGHGVYGDRYVIGKVFPWGYSHNIFLEILVSFGYLGGGILCLALICGVFKLYAACRRSVERQIVFISFFTAALKLMLSNSFWYTRAFWVLLALTFMWKQQNCAKKKCNNVISGLEDSSLIKNLNVE